MPELAYLENRFLPLDEARVPINDRGYLFADGIYEVVVTRNGAPFLFREHFARFKRSAQAIGLQLPFSFTELEDLVKEGIAQAGFAETMVYIQVTRGIEPRRHEYSDNLAPAPLLTFRPRPEYPESLRRNGIAIITVPEIRWQRCDIKSIALLPNVMMKQQAVEQGSKEALFVTPEGVVHEGTAANIFFAADGVLHTPPADQHILAGITRGFIIAQARARGLEVRDDKECRLEELLAADEVFITSSTVDIMPVIRVDKTRIGSGRPGPLSQTVRSFFAET